MALVGRKGKFSISGKTADVQEITWQRYEDVLTADIFGAYRYLPVSLGLLPILERAIDENRQSLVQYLERFDIVASNLDVARLRFWPRFLDASEPDVFAFLTSTKNDRSVAILVEAKYFATQHKIGTRSQLGHYLIQHLANAYTDGSISWTLPNRPRPILFITKHDDVPLSELVQARDEAATVFPKLMASEIGVFWVNWATVGSEARRLWARHRENVESAPWLRLLLDVYEEIRDRDLLPRPPFTGIPSPSMLDQQVIYKRNYGFSKGVSLRIPAFALRHYREVKLLVGLPAAPSEYVRSYQLASPGWEQLPTIPCPYAQETDPHE